MENRFLAILVLFIGLAVTLAVNFVGLGLVIELLNYYLVKNGFAHTSLDWRQSLECGVALTFFIQAFALFLPRRLKWR